MSRLLTHSAALLLGCATGYAASFYHHLASDAGEDQSKVHAPAKPLIQEAEAGKAAVIDPEGSAEGHLEPAVEILQEELPTRSDGLQKQDQHSREECLKLSEALRETSSELDQARSTIRDQAERLTKLDYRARLLRRSVKELQCRGDSSERTKLESSMDAVFSFVAGQVGRRFSRVVLSAGTATDQTASELEGLIEEEVQQALEGMLHHAWGFVDANHDGELSVDENRELVSVYTSCLSRWIPLVVDSGIDAMMDAVVPGWRSSAELQAVADQVKAHFTQGMRNEVCSDPARCGLDTADQIWSSMDENADGRVVRSEFVGKFLDAVRIVPTLVHTTCQAAKCIHDLVNDKHLVQNLS